MEREEFELLMTSQAGALLEELRASAKLDSAKDVVALVSGLRAKGVAAPMVAAVLTQAKLQRRAASKFGQFAQRMIFTEPGLEQATRLAVAAHHAQRFRAAGMVSVADLGCGIGADAMAFASLGLGVQAFEADEVTAAVAAYNLAIFDEVTVANQDVTELGLDEFQGLWFDPARRALDGPKRDRHRRLEPADFSPNLDWVFSKASGRAAGVKLGPGVDHDLIPEDAEAEWVSHEGDLVELTLWFGPLRRPGVTRSALMLRDSKQHRFDAPVIDGTTSMQSAAIADVGRYIFEPDASLIRSHLMGPFATSLGMWGIANDIAYLSSNQAIESPWLRGFEVIDNLPLDIKKLRAWFMANDIGTVEIKKRGVDITPEQLRPQLKLKGAGSLTLILTRVKDTRRAIIARPLP